MILVEGNAAGALGCMMAGVTVVAWYPITPSSSLPEALIGYMKKYRIDKETGKATFAIVQAEDEIASIGMVVGAGWAGARAMTSTSGPGISLMGEFAGLAYYAEVPGVVFDIQRVGPSTGPSDAHRAGRHPARPRCSRTATRSQIMLLPASVGGVLHDGDGRVRPRRALPDARLRDERPRPRHEHLDVARRSRIPEGRSIAARCSTRRRWSGSGEWGRYKDVDGDGIPYRTLPGTGMPAYFTRGSGHNERGQYSERPDDYVDNMDRLARKFETARQYVPRPIVDERRRRARSGSSATAPATGRSTRAAISSRDEAGLRDRLPAAARVSVHRGRSRRSSIATSASTSSSRTATRRCWRCCGST